MSGCHWKDQWLDIVAPNDWKRTGLSEREATEVVQDLRGTETWGKRCSGTGYSSSSFSSSSTRSEVHRAWGKRVYCQRINVNRGIVCGPDASSEWQGVSKSVRRIYNIRLSKGQWHPDSGQVQEPWDFFIIISFQLKCKRTWTAWPELINIKEDGAEQR